MKKYIKPNIKVVSIDTTHILAGSIQTDVSEAPATEPACAKQHTIFNNDESGSTWDEW
jgi:hypothetical protein